MIETLHRWTLSPDQINVNIHLPFSEIGESEPRGFKPESRGFKPWLNQTNDFKIDKYHFLAWRSTLLG